MKLVLILGAMSMLCAEDANKARDAELRKPVEDLYAAMNARDVKAVVNCYHPDVPNRDDVRLVIEGVMKFDLQTNQRLKKFKVERVKGHRAIVVFTVRTLKAGGHDFFLANDTDCRLLLKKHEGKWYWWGEEMVGFRVLPRPNWKTPTITLEEVDKKLDALLARKAGEEAKAKKE